MIVVVTNQSDVTADFVVAALRNRDAEFVRFNTDELLTEWRLSWSTDGWTAVGSDGVRLQSDEVTSVYYRRPQDPQPIDGTAAEAAPFVLRESRALLKGLYATTTAAWISHPQAIHEAEDKLHQLKVAQKLGFDVPRTLVTHDPAAARNFCNDTAAVVVKPLSGGLLTEEPALIAYCEAVASDWDFSDVSLCPHLFQERIEKIADIRVTIVDDQVFACRISSQVHPGTILDWRRGSAIGVKLPHEMIALDASQQVLCRKLLSALGLRFGAVDLVERPNGAYAFLEINPNGQWAWIETLTKAPISSAIAEALIVPPNGARA